MKSARAAILPLAVIALAAWLAGPSLLAAWRDDVYARGAPLAFGIWTLALVSRRPRGASERGFLWLALALAGIVLGSLAGLRVALHGALAAAVIGGCAAGWLRGLIGLAAALSWLPASGWFLSHAIGGGLQGWERPLLALALGIALVFTPSSFPRKTHHLMNR